MAAPRGVLRVLRVPAAVVGVAVGGTMAVALAMLVEALWAHGKLLEYNPLDFVPDSDLFGSNDDGEILDLAMLGDSLAVGVGAEGPERTIGYMLADGLAKASERPVRLRNVAAIGGLSADLPGQVAALAEQRFPQVAVIVVGGNDVMNFRKTAAAVEFLSQAVRDLRRGGGRVVVATCPDVGTVRPIVHPLRFFAHWSSVWLATAQTIVVLRNGGRTVSLADTLGPSFHRQPHLMFSIDKLHPSSHGYQYAVEVLLPSVCAAAGYRTPQDALVPHRIYRKERRSRLAWLAFRASRRASLHSGALSAVAERAGEDPLLTAARVQPLG